MEIKKFIVEIKVTEAVLRILAGAHLSLKDAVDTRINQILFPITKGPVLVYPEGDKPSINLFEICPVCGHPWGKHFEYLDAEGKPTDPRPGRCGDCPPGSPCLAMEVMKGVPNEK